MRTDRWHSIARLRADARRALPRPVFDYIDGGAEDEVSLARATAAFDEHEWLPQSLVDVSTLVTGTRLFGRDVPWPLMLSPTGLTGLFHPGAERAVARAAGAHGLPYALSTLGTTTIEEVAATGAGPKLFQIYLFKDRGLTEEFVERARAARYDGLIVTVDTLVAGKRERDIVNGLSLPPRLTPRSFLDYALKPRWSLPALFGRKFDFVNVAHRVAAMAAGPTSLAAYVNGQFDRTLTWADVEWLAARWKGPLAVKGILSTARRASAVDAGADTVMVSNHGGRQMDSALPPVSAIPAVAEAVGGRATVICDGGVRRGAHVAKALALGADACAIGRPYLYGLAAGGEAGVSRALELLREEFERTLILLGAPSLDALTPDLLRTRGWPSGPGEVAVRGRHEHA